MILQQAGKYVAGNCITGVEVASTILFEVIILSNTNTGESKKIRGKDDKKRTSTIQRDSEDAAVVVRKATRQHSLILDNAGETRMSADLRLLDREVTGFNGRSAATAKNKQTKPCKINR